MVNSGKKGVQKGVKNRDFGGLDPGQIVIYILVTLAPNKLSHTKALWFWPFFDPFFDHFWPFHPNTRYGWPGRSNALPLSMRGLRVKTDDFGFSETFLRLIFFKRGGSKVIWDFFKSWNYWSLFFKNSDFGHFWSVFFHFKDLTFVRNDQESLIKYLCYFLVFFEKTENRKNTKKHVFSCFCVFGFFRFFWKIVKKSAVFSGFAYFWPETTFLDPLKTWKNMQKTCFLPFFGILAKMAIFDDFGQFRRLLRFWVLVAYEIWQGRHFSKTGSNHPKMAKMAKKPTMVHI